MGYKQVESKQHLFAVGQVTDDAADGQRQLANQHRRGQDLFVLGQLWTFQHVDDQDLVLAAEIMLTDPAQVGNRCRGTSGVADDIKLQ